MVDALESHVEGACTQAAGRAAVSMRTGLLIEHTYSR